MTFNYYLLKIDLLKNYSNFFQEITQKWSKNTNCKFLELYKQNGYLWNI